MSEQEKRKAGRPERFTAQEMAEAIEEARGLISVAARMKRCSPETVRRYIRVYPTVAKAKAEAEEKLGDQVELTLAAMALGERDQSGGYIREPNVTCLIFLAKTKFKNRGYVERREVTGKDGAPAGPIVVFYADDEDGEGDGGEEDVSGDGEDG